MQLLQVTVIMIITQCMKFPLLMCILRHTIINGIISTIDIKRLQ